MELDLRWPIGLMFALLGALLFFYGVATTGDAMYARSLGYNVNLWWGAGLLGFGAVVLILLRRGRRKVAPSAGADGRAAPRAGDR